MGILADLSAKLGNARRAEQKIIAEIATKAKTLPEYKDFEKAVVAIETRASQYMSASHPASEVNPGDHQQMMGRLSQDVQASASKLYSRLTKEGVAEEHMHDVMNALNAEANKLASPVKVR
jgi:hypothetical protein